MNSLEFCSRWEQLRDVHDDIVNMETEINSNPLKDDEVREAVAGALKSADSVADDVALRMVSLYPTWTEDAQYNISDRVQEGGVLYRCLQAHNAQADWTPSSAPSLWAKVLIPDEDVIPEWEQPDSTNPYGAGDKVLHNGVVWRSDVGVNVWEPGVYGWTDITEKGEA